MLILDNLVFLNNLPPELATLLISFIPIGELRAAIPIGIFTFKLSVYAAFFWAVIGNMIPVFFLLWLLGPVTNWLRNNFKWAEKFFNWLFQRTRHKFEAKYLKYGALALMLFVAVPLPVTGAWTGALAAFIFGIPKKVSFLFIFLGVIIAGIIVSLISQGTLGFLNWLLV